MEKKDETKMKCEKNENWIKYFFSIFVVFSSLVFPRNKERMQMKKKPFFFFSFFPNIGQRKIKQKE